MSVFWWFVRLALFSCVVLLEGAANNAALAQSTFATNGQLPVAFQPRGSIWPGQEVAAVSEPVFDDDTPIFRRQDGDLAVQPQNENRDGQLAAVQPVQQQDGDLSGDGRYFEPTPSNGEAQAEIAPQPPTGRRRRPAEPNPPGPYDPLGIRVGSFLVRPDIAAEMVYTDNVLALNSPIRSDTVFQLRPAISVQSQWSRHELRFDAVGLASWHSEFTSEDDRDINARVNGRIDISKHTNIGTDASYALFQEQRSSVDTVGGAVNRPNVQTWGVGARGEHRVSRLSVRLSGGFERTDNDAAVLADGTIVEQPEENEQTTVIALRTGYQFSPAFTGFVLAEWDRHRFDAAVPDDGIKRDGDGYQVRAGWQGELGPTITGEASLGYGQRTPDDDRLETIEGIMIDANVNWAPTALTSFNLRAGTEINATTLTASPGSIDRSIDLDVRHELRRNIILQAGIGYFTQSYTGSDLKEDQITARANAEYLLNREIALLASYEHTSFDSNAANRDYDENRVGFGVRIRR